MQNQNPHKKNNHTSTKFTQSDIRPYKSIYKAGYVTESAYIAEIIFEKRSVAFNSGKLPENFWNEQKYIGQFKGQIIQASRLLRKYSGSSIIKALKDDRAKYILKLQNKKLIPIIEDYEKNKKEKILEQEKLEKLKPSIPFKKKNNILGEL